MYDLPNYRHRSWHKYDVLLYFIWSTSKWVKLYIPVRMQPNKCIGDSENIDGWPMAIHSLQLRRGLMLLYHAFIGWFLKCVSLTNQPTIVANPDDVIKWKHFPRNWPFVRGIHRSPLTAIFRNGFGEWEASMLSFFFTYNQYVCCIFVFSLFDPCTGAFDNTALC